MRGDAIILIMQLIAPIARAKDRVGAMDCTVICMIPRLYIGGVKFWKNLISISTSKHSG